MHEFENKAPAEKITVTFDFSAELNGETITSASVAIAVLTGEDAAAAAMLSGAATFPSPFTQVLQSVVNGVAGVDYRLTCTANTATRILQLAATLPVRLAT
jgi:hypothetical protein